MTNQMDFSSASPSFRLHHRPATLLQKQRATECGREKIKATPVGRTAVFLALERFQWLLYEQSCYGAAMALPVKWHEPAGSLSCQSNWFFCPYGSEWLWHQTHTNMHARTHTHTRLYRLCSHLSPNTHMLTLLIITSLALKHTFHTHLYWLQSERVVGSMPNALHFQLCSDIYLHRWRCHCCWRLFCTGPERELCEGDGRSADPTETPAKDHNFHFHWSQLKHLRSNFKQSLLNQCKLFILAIILNKFNKKNFL